MKFRVVWHLLLLYPLLAPAPMLGQSVNFRKNIYSNAPYSFATADLNNDGREDLIQVCGSSNGDFAVSLSTADATYSPQVCYHLPAGAVYGVAVGDFNGDGYLDLAVFNGTNTFYEYVNLGDGTFRLQGSFITPVSQITSMVAADVNHDGLIDLIFDGFNDAHLYVWLGNGNSGFTAGPTSTIQVSGELSIGDFDGDGNVDILSQFNTYGNSIQADYGDGKGHFQAAPVFSDDAAYQPYDLNGDGRMDLVGDPFDFSLNGSTYYKIVRVQYGNSNRTFTRRDIPLSQCTVGATYPAVADFNGDGIKDIVVAEASDCKGSGPYTVNVLLGKADGTFQPEQEIYSSNVTPNLYIMRANQDTKPDMYFYGYFQNTSNTEGIFFTDTTPGPFPKCASPNSGTGIALCSPTRSVISSSPVKFSIGAANQTPGRKVEVWIDGEKAGEELNAWSHYSFLDSTLNLANGSHSVTVYSAGWDNLIEVTTFPLTVGSSQCAPPANAGLNVCSPLNDSALGSSVLAWASGAVDGTIARMEVWVDGVKMISTSGSGTLKQSVSLAAGSHTFVFYIVNTAEEKWSQTVIASVK
jgi:hypothetical protein